MFALLRERLVLDWVCKVAARAHQLKSTKRIEREDHNKEGQRPMICKLFPLLEFAAHEHRCSVESDA